MMAGEAAHVPGQALRVCAQARQEVDCHSVPHETEGQQQQPERGGTQTASARTGLLGCGARGRCSGRHGAGTGAWVARGRTPGRTDGLTAAVEGPA